MSKQTISYQEFVLNTEGKKLEDLTSKPGDLEKVIRTIEERGFQVLTSPNTISGMPEYLLVGGKKPGDYKKEFYEVTEPLGWSYRAGIFFSNSQEIQQK
jgi:hypothetical protein